MAIPSKHPLAGAIFDAFWIQRGIDPRWVRNMMTGKAVTSRAFAKAMLTEFGVALESWPDLEPVLPGKWLHGKKGRVTIDGDMTATGTAAPHDSKPPPKRRGRRISLDGPVTVAARNSGLSMMEIAGALGASYSAAKAWNSRRRGPVWVRRALSRPPYNVADSDWAT